MRADTTRHARTLNAKSELKTLMRQFRELVQEGKKDEAQKFYPMLSRRLDQAASRGILHKNTVSRKKSRLARSLAAAK